MKAASTAASKEPIPWILPSGTYSFLRGEEWDSLSAEGLVASSARKMGKESVRLCLVQGGRGRLGHKIAKHINGGRVPSALSDGQEWALLQHTEAQ